MSITHGTSSNAAMASVSFVKNNTDCDTPAARSGIFATSSSPWSICTAAQFNEIRNYLGDDFEIKNHLDLSSLGNFTPIPTGFTGSLDGNLFTLSNLTISEAGQSNIGLFSYLNAGASLLNMMLVDVSITGAGNVGALAGNINGAGVSLSNINIDGLSMNLTATGGGGLIGYLDNAASLTASSIVINDLNLSGSDGLGGLLGTSHPTAGLVTMSSISLTGTNTITGSGVAGYIGGIAGNIIQGTMNTCHVAGTLSSKGPYAGGVFGFYGGSTLNDCVSSMKITADSSSAATSYIGGLVGRIDHSPTHANLKRNHTTGLVSISGVAPSFYTCGHIGYARVLNIQDSTSDGNISNSSGDGTALNQTGGKYIGGFVGAQVTNTNDVVTINNITVNGTTTGMSYDISPLVGGYAGQLYSGNMASVSFDTITINGAVIGTNNFTGGFTGESHLSSNGAAYSYNKIKYQADTLQNFQYGWKTAAGGQVIKEASSVGGLIGELLTYEYSDFTFTGTLRHQGKVISSGSFVGGLIGQFSSGIDATLTLSGASSSKGNITSNSHYVGGHIGSVTGIGNCNITLQGITAGGAIGHLYPLSTCTTSISNSTSYQNISLKTIYGGGFTGAALGYQSYHNTHAKGNITASSYYIGGLLGGAPLPSVSISNSSAASNITVNFSAPSASGQIGGLAGKITGATTNSYATGNITINLTAAGSLSDAYVGGLSGYSDISSVALFTNIYATGSVNRIASSARTSLFGTLMGACGADTTVLNGFYNSTTSIVDPVITTPETDCNTNTANETRALSDSQMKVSGNFTGFDFAGSLESSWENSSPPTLPGMTGAYLYPLNYWFSN